MSVVTSSQTLKVPTAMKPEGIPIVSPPVQDFNVTDYIKKGIFFTIIQIVAPSILAVKYVSDKPFRSNLDSLYTLVNDADCLPDEAYFQDPKLLKRVWELPSAQHYVRNGALSYQKMEGYCGVATLGCILKSFDSFPAEWVPQQLKSGPQTPETWSSNLREHVEKCNKSGSADENIQIEPEIIQCDALQYDEFLKTIRRLNGADQKGTRLAINYLRPALTGFQWPKWLPMNFLLGLFSGHFSPVVGVLEHNRPPNDPLVAVFDVNHKYGGTYLVPATRLFASIQSKDIMTGKSRGMVVVTQA